MGTRFDSLISAEALSELLGKGDDEAPLVILDARFDLTDTDAGRRAHAAHHLPGARFADLDRDLSGPITATSGRHPLPDADTLGEKLTRWGVASQPQTQVVVYDAASGAFAARLWWLLRWLGHEAVAVLDGGLARWQALGLPLSDQIPTLDPAPAPFEASPIADRWISTTALVQALATDAVVLADARAAPRFRGEQEPIDPVAGHVPDAVNRPFEQNLAPTGLFRRREELRRQYEALLGNRASEAFVAMCGSGVTACHLLLALKASGLGDGRLYAGSWSEWIRDPNRPVAP